MIPFIGNNQQDVKYVSSKVQVPPLLHEHRNAALGYFTSPQLALGAIRV